MRDLSPSSKQIVDMNVILTVFFYIAPLISYLFAALNVDHHHQREELRGAGAA